MAERFLYGVAMNLPWSRCMKVRRDTSVNGEEERGLRIILQLTRVVPPRFSVPFGGRGISAVLCLSERSECYKSKRRRKHGKGKKVGKKYYTA
mgnify:CR=1 FL=1